MANNKKISIRKKTESPPELRKLGTFLSRSRQKAGMTMTEAASELGLKSGQSIWDWENSKGSGIPADMLLKLTKIYKISQEKAYEELLQFHCCRAEHKVKQKFEKAKAELSRKKK